MNDIIKTFYCHKHKIPELSDFYGLNFLFKKNKCTKD